MRLIDADVLKQHIDKLPALPDGNFAGNHSALKALINMQPTIQPVEPKRGRWILDRSGAYCCSECMEPCASYVMMKPRDKYCKMCGAKMEVDNEQT